MAGIRLDLVLDCADPQQLASFWQSALGYRVLSQWDGGIALVPESRGLPPLLLQQVPEPKASKNRMHLDLVTPEVENEVHRLEALGAHRLHEGLRRHGDVGWVTMADPEGNEFCVCSGFDW